MSIHYDLYDTPDIRQTGEKQPLHPRAVFKGKIDAKEFLDRVHRVTGMSHGMLSGVMLAFQNELSELLANGWVVEMGEIGSFSVSLQGPPVMTKKEVRAASIELKNVIFRSSKYFKRELSGKMRFVRAARSAKRKEHSEEECLAIVGNYLKTHPFLTRNEYSRLTGRNKNNALRDLNAFIERGTLQRYGAGKQVVYGKVMKGEEESGVI